MREILFRGKRDDGEWIYGSLLKVTFDGTTYNLIFADNFLFVFGQATAMEHAAVIQETVGQFTGLTDKNGKKIFEGDIVESEFTKKPYFVCFGEYTYVDEYGDESSACGWYNEEKGGYLTAFGSPDAWATVIGNIHDNPELLGGAEDESKV